MLSSLKNPHKLSFEYPHSYRYLCENCSYLSEIDRNCRIFFYHHLSDNYVYFSDFYVDLPVIYVDMSLCRLVRKIITIIIRIYMVTSLVRLLC